MSEPLRVLHGPVASANQPWTLAEALRRRGHVADNVVVKPHRFEYRATIQAPRASIELVDELARRFDVFHLHGRSFLWSGPSFAFPSLLDLAHLRLLGKTVVFHFRGREARLRSEFERLNPFHYRSDDPAESRRLYLYDEPAQRMMIDHVRSLADAVFVVDPELEAYVPGAEIVPRAIDLAEWEEVGPVSDRRPLLVHAPSQRNIKGTAHVLEAVEALRREGLPFEFELVDGRPHTEAKRAYERADVIVDGLHIGWYGVLAVEGMALGKAVVSYVRSDLVDRLGPEPPLAVADPTTVTEVLRELVLDADARVQLGAAARRYCERVHDAGVIAESLERTYRRLRSQPTATEGITQYLRFHTAQSDRTRRVVLLGATDLARDPLAVAVARTLAGAGHDVVAVSALVGADRSEAEAEGYRTVRVPVAPPGAGKRGAAARARHKRYRAAWADVVRAESPDVVHVFGHEGLGAGAASARAARVVYDARPGLPGPEELDELLPFASRLDGVLTGTSEDARMLAAALELRAPPTVAGGEEEGALLELYDGLFTPKDDAWYDRLFTTSTTYPLPYEESIYYPCWKRIAQRLRELGASSIIDLGCGPGQFAALLRDAGIRRYLGLDFSRVAVERAREVCPEFEFRVDDVRTSDTLATWPYDIAVCLETLEHLEDDREVLGRIRPGTNVVATVPDFAAQGHVRHFRSEDEVEARYAGVLADLQVERFVLSPKASLFVFEGRATGRTGAPTGSPAAARRPAAPPTPRS